jgi:hypothetical protein
VLGATSEAFSDALERYCADNPDGLLRPGGDGDGKDEKKDEKKDKKKDKKKEKRGGGGGGGGGGVPEDMKVDADGEAARVFWGAGAARAGQPAPGSQSSAPAGRPSIGLRRRTLAANRSHQPYT